MASRIKKIYYMVSQCAVLVGSPFCTRSYCAGWYSLQVLPPPKKNKKKKISHTLIVCKFIKCAYHIFFWHVWYISRYRFDILRCPDGQFRYPFVPVRIINLLSWSILMNIMLSRLVLISLFFIHIIIQLITDPRKPVVTVRPCSTVLETVRAILNEFIFKQIPGPPPAY